VPFLPSQEPLLLQDRHFVRCALEGTRPRTDGQNGLAVVEVLESVQLSLRERRRVEVAEVREGRRGPAAHEPAAFLVGSGRAAEA
jgi:hypothetical protein